MASTGAPGRIVGGYTVLMASRLAQGRAPQTRSTGWTDERVAELTKLWKRGLSATQIADRLGGNLTRNAVIGKVHRLGLAARRMPASPPARLTKAPKVARSHVCPPKPGSQNKPALVWGANEKARPKAPTQAERREAFATIPPTAAPLIGRPFGACAWPVGTPDTPANQLACCAPKAEGWPYCEAHARIAAGAPARKSGKDYVRAILRLAA